jgi:hypothetical protein
LLDLGGHYLLPILGLLVALVPRNPKDVYEHPLGQPVPADEGSCDEPALVGKHEVARPFDADVALGDEALDPLGHRRGGESEALADARLDDALALLLELEDGLEVLLGGGIEVAKLA